MKNPLVSVIVPTKNSAEFLEACLKSIESQTYKSIELIVVDNFSTDNTRRIAKKYTNKFYLKGPERSAQRNYGVNKSSGEYVAIIDSDMELTPKVIESCIEVVGDGIKSRAVIIPEESYGEGFWAQCKKLERSFYLGIDWMEAARFFSKNTFIQLGGYNELNTGTEDYDLPQRIESVYGRHTITRTTEIIMHNEQKLSLLKTCKKKYYYAQKLNIYLKSEVNKSKFKSQASIFSRYKIFFAKPKLLFRNPFLGVGLLVMKTLEFSFGGFGYIRGKFTS